MEVKKLFFLIGLLLLICIVILLVYRLKLLQKKYTEVLFKKSNLQLEKNQFERLINTVSDIIYSADSQGFFTDTNETITAVLGYHKEEIIGLPFQKLIHDSDVDRIQQAYYEHFTKKLKQSYHEFLVKRKDGSAIWVGQQVTSMFNKSDPNKIDGFYGVVRDINDRKVAELKLAKQESTLRQITETLTDVFYLYNIKDKKYEYISPNCESILGKKSDFFYNNNIFNSKHVIESFQKRLIEAQNIVESGETYSIDYQIKVEEEVRWINEKSFPIFNEQGEVIANSGICRDISDLKKAEEIIHNQNVEIGLSIQYAKSIQDAVLPSNERISSFVNDSFVMFKPKDIVSGDFYVVDYINTNEGIELPTFIVGDCTGHGVPGAVLSLMCNVLVRESFSRLEVNTPAEALEFVRSRLIAFLCAQEEKRIYDGMDIAFCVINKAKNQLYFSGAHSACVLIHNGALIEFKGDKQHVGFDEFPQPFSNQIIDFQKGDAFFIFTDGYMDQFGGEKNKKYSKKKFYQTLLENSHLPMKKIKEVLENEFIDWRKDYHQIDDVTVLGVRYE